MNYTKLFYWLTVADNAKTMFVVGIIIFTIIGVVATIAYLTNSGEEQKLARKWMWWSYPFMILFWTLYIFTPNKRDALLIVAGGQTLNFLTTDSTAKSIPHELTKYAIPIGSKFEKVVNPNPLPFHVPFIKLLELEPSLLQLKIKC